MCFDLINNGCVTALAGLGGFNPVILIVLALVLVAGGAAVLIIMLEEKKRVKDTPAAGTDSTSPTDEGEEDAYRFCMLSRIDARREELEGRPHDTGVTLRRFCDDFRSYAASELKLYYSIEDIRRFIAGFAVSQILILQGM